MKNILLTIMMIMLALLLTGCGAAGKRSNKAGDDFHYTLPAGGEEIAPIIVTAKTPPSMSKNDTTSFSDFNTSRVQSRAEQEGWGYRIQIFSTLEQDEAESEAANARQKLEENVFVEFDPPYYKVRVGNCKDSDEAEQLLSKVKRKGFPDAWIVRARVISE